MGGPKLLFEDYAALVGVSKGCAVVTGVVRSVDSYDRPVTRLVRVCSVCGTETLTSLSQWRLAKYARCRCLGKPDVNDCEVGDVKGIMKIVEIFKDNVGLGRRVGKTVLRRECAVCGTLSVITYGNWVRGTFSACRCHKEIKPRAVSVGYAAHLARLEARLEARRAKRLAGV